MVDTNLCTINQDEHVIQNFCRRKPKEERRSRTLYSHIAGVFKRQRIHARREEDRQFGHYVDIYELEILGMLLVILTLCVMDAFFTLSLIDKGSEELNIFMKALIEHDTVLFITIKILLTAISLMLIVLHKNFIIFKKFRVAHLLPATLVLYLVLINYELFMLY